MVAHLDHLGGRHDVEPLGRALLGGEQLADARLVAEEHDTAFGADGVERHDGAPDRSLGGEVAAHGIYTNL